MSKIKSVADLTKIFGVKYTSKSIRGECKNEKCKKDRRHGSAYCQKCSDKHNKKKK